MPDITAIIPTLSNTKGLFRLLNELHIAGIPAVVVDNGPTAEKKGLLQNDPGGITYLPQQENTYFAKAINVGSRECGSAWLLIANDDIEGIAANKISSLIQFAEKHNWQAVSPVLRNPQGTIENIGYTVLPIGRAVLNFDKNRNSDQTLDGLTAACLLIKRDLFKQVGGFDESFIAYLEDVDLFIRLKKAGYHFGVCPDVSVRHNHMTTSAKMRGFKQKRDLVNWIKIIRKNWNRSDLVRYSTEIIVERLRNLNGLIKIYVNSDS